MSQAATTTRLPLASISSAQLSQAFLSAHDEGSTPLEELIATGTAAFELIRHLDCIELPIRMVFEQMEKQFVVYAGLVGE